jgi:DNA-binding NarL/FixJ family response regulator
MKGTRVLLADDHAVVRAGIRKVVEELEGITIVGEANSGPSLLAALHELDLDCLLVDLSMPNFDPLVTIPEIRKQYPRLKILVVSAYDDDEYVQGLLTEGINGYHLKDQPLSDLKLALVRVLEGDRWISSSLINKLLGQSRMRGAVPMLTMRQRDILKRLQEGLDNYAIAQDLNLSIKTIENHLTRLYRQLQVRSRLEAVNYVNQRPEVLGVSGVQMNPRTAPAPRAQSGLNILLVDDNQRYLQQIQRVLGKVYPQAGLYEAQSIASAVQMTQRIQPNLIFVDVVLGDEDGIRCVRRVKAVAENARVIVMSAYPDREFHRLSMEAGAVAFLDKKDLDVRTLRQVVDDQIA